MHLSFGHQAGIAIRPVLVLVALLALGAVVIAAASNRLTAGLSRGNEQQKAAAILQIGDNLKAGIDRLFAENKIPFAYVDTNIANTSGNNRLFSPTGGGIKPPSWSMANQPSSDGTAAHGDIWYFPQGAVPGLGTSAPEMLAVLKVSQVVCDEINAKALDIPTPTASDLGNFYAIANDTSLLTAWPAPLNGRTAGCVQNSNADSKGYFFFEVLAIQ